MIRVLVSSCLLGEPVRYHGGDALCPSRILDRWRAEGRLVAVNAERITIARDAGELDLIHVHFPRVGYVLSAA